MDKDERKNENENDNNDENNEEENNEKYHFIIGSGSENFESSCHHSNKKKWKTICVYPKIQFYFNLYFKKLIIVYNRLEH